MFIKGNCDIPNPIDSPKYFKSKLYNLVLSSPLIYNQQLCYFQCLQEKLIERFNCTDPRIMSLFDSRDCETYEETKCKDNALEGFLLEEYSFSECQTLCPLECNFSDFHATLSSNKLIGDLFLKYINENKNLKSDFINRTLNSETAADSVVKVNVSCNF